METTLNKSTPNAPLNEINGGLVSYLNQGANSVIKARRNDAYKKMHDQCKGNYNIVEEGEHLGAGAVVPIGNVAFYGKQQEWKIKFECVH